MCYVCGKDNPAGFKLHFEHPHKGLLKATVTFKKEHQGYKNIVHGGLLATLLDEMMVNLAWKEGSPVVSAELNVRLKKPCPVGEPVYLEGKIEKDGGRAIYASAAARDAGGELYATATATCLRVKTSV